MTANRQERILVAGAGGQGVMLLGRIIAEAALLEGKKVTYLRSYGAAMRGGTANCWVKISKKEIRTPVFEKSTVSIILNSPSFDKFSRDINFDGCLIVNSSLVDTGRYNPKKVILREIPANHLASELNNIKVANVIVLGYLIKTKPVIGISSVQKAMEKLFRETKGVDPEVLRQNTKALHRGFSYG